MSRMCLGICFFVFRWDKPRELTNYVGHGYENYVGGSRGWASWRSWCKYIYVLFPQTFSKDIATIFESLVFHLHHHIGQVSLKEPEILHVRRATTTAANRKRLTWNKKWNKKNFMLPCIKKNCLVLVFNGTHPVHQSRRQTHHLREGVEGKIFSLQSKIFLANTSWGACLTVLWGLT